MASVGTEKETTRALGRVGRAAAEMYPGHFALVMATGIISVAAHLPGAWWIPLLFILGLWRHLYKRFPLRYDPQYWGMVFPLGMYTVCTFQLSKALDFEPLLLIPRYFIYVALAAWLLAFAGLLHALLFKNHTR